jgi:hypothetical protein
MYSERKNIYADDLINITVSFKAKTNSIIDNLSNEVIVNQGLFIMTTALFEDAIREIMRLVLTSFPEKLQIKTCTITKKQVCEIADFGHSVIIENELYLLFKDGVKKQLEYLLEVLCNIDKNDYTPELTENIDKLTDISLFRNSLIHNGGKASISLKENAKYYKVEGNQDNLTFSKNLVKQFINDYLNMFNLIEEKVKSKFKFYENSTRVEKLRNLWGECFSSPLLNFDNYWQIDFERDLIVDIKYSKFEDSISSNEKVLLSIWRHQFNDSIKTEEFLLCSVNYNKIFNLYKGLDDTKFYHMLQQA